MNIFYKKNNKGFTRTPKFGVTPKGGGFTLVETLIAISIFTISILGIMSVLGSSIASTNYAKKKIIASYLAQEGIEYIRNMRDTYVLYGATSQAGWDAFKTKVAAGGNAVCALPNDHGCYLEDQDLVYTDQSQPMTKIDVQSCGSTCPVLLYDTTTGKYGYVSGTNSGFTRKIIVDQISTNEIKVSSSISWTQGSGSYSMVLSESLFNWLE